MKKFLFFIAVCFLLSCQLPVLAQCPAISGLTSVCLGNSTTLSNSSAGGAWSSGNTNVATVDAGSGVVAAVSAGQSVITYNGGCGTVTATVTVQTSAPGPITGTVGPCVSSFAQVANSVGGGVWSSSDVAIFNINSAGVISSYAIGSANITYTTGCGSPATRTISFTSRSPMYIYGATVNVTGAIGYICLGATTTLSNDGVPTATWSSSNPGVATINATTGVVTSSGVAGTTNITASNVCFFVSRYINLHAADPTAISGNLSICGTGTTMLSNGTSPGTWSSGNIMLATVSPSTGAVFGTGTGTGFVPITYTYAGGCSVTTTVTVTAVPGVITGASNVCVGAVISLSNDANGGAWSSGNTGVATISPGGVVTGVAAGNSVITYATSCGSATMTVTVGNAAAPITGTQNLCGALTTTLSNAASPGTWSSGNTSVATIEPATGVVHVVPGGGTGTVPITFTAAGGCSALATLTVTVPVSAIGGTLNICAGNSMPLSNASPGGTWTSGATSVATIDMNTGIVTGASAGTTVITYTGACGFTTASLTVGAQPMFVAPDQMCIGQIRQLNSSVPGGIWSVDNPAVATVTSAGVVTTIGGGYFRITYTLNPSGCSVTHTIVAGSANVPASTIICAGATVSPSGTLTGGTWTSTNPLVATVDIVTGLITGVDSGVTAIFYISSNECVPTNSVVVLPSTLPPITGAQEICVGGGASLSNAVNGGTWSSADISVATVGAVSGYVSGLSQGLTIISYSTPCSSVNAVVIVDGLPSISGPTMLCVANTIILSASVAGGTWSSGDNAIATVDAAGMVTGVIAGTAVISYSMPGNCISTIVLTTYDPPAAIAGKDTVCKGASIVLSDAVPGGVWSSSSVAATISTGGVVTGLSPGTVTITYAILPISEGACFATKTVVVVPLPDAGAIAGSDTLCAGATVQLSETVNGGVWSSGNVAVASIQNPIGSLHALGEGISVITYTVTGAGGCVGQATFTVAVVPRSFELQASVSQVSCYGGMDGSITININGSKPAYQYLWSTGATTKGINGLDTGYYTLAVQEPLAQCKIDTGFYVSQPGKLMIAASATADLCGRGTGIVSIIVTGGTPAYSYLWSTNATGDRLEGVHAGSYSVTVTDINNCTEQQMATVADSSCGPIVIHDVITPNGDGYNDVWVIEGIASYPGNTVQIFDKWGDKVFDRSNYSNDWNGSGRNGLLPDGTYYYLIKLNAVNATGGSDTFTGTVLIKR